MKPLNRHGFLKRATGAVLGTLGFLYPGAPSAFGGPRRGVTAGAPQGSEPSSVNALAGRDPGFCSGEVVGKNPQGVVLQSIDETRAVRIPPGTGVWKEFDDLDPSVIDIGDWVDVRGTPLEDGTIVARSGWIWANIGRRDGTFRGRAGRGISMRDDRGRDHVLELSSRLEVIHAEDGRSLARGLDDLAAGMPIGAVGLRLPDGGFRATRVWRH